MGIDDTLDDDADEEYLEERETRGRKKITDYPALRPGIEKGKALTYPEWAPLYHKIRDVHGRLVPFKLNEIQMRLDAEWERQMVECGYVRLVILKARKEGASAYVQGKAKRAVLEREGWNAGIMAHEDSSCDAIFDRTKTFADELPPAMRRTLIRNNRKEIAYAKPHKSKVVVNVAKGKGGFGRGWDVHIVHLSEVAFWPNIRGQSTAQGQASAIINSMPRVSGTAVVIESTANGIGNEFHSIWQKAVDKKNGFIPVFFGWQDFHLYRLPGRKPDEFPSEEEWDAEEEGLRALGIDDEQLAWRRWKIANDCNGDLDTFHQEFPSRAEEAFLASGRPVFPGTIIQERLDDLYRREKWRPTRSFSFDSKGLPEVDPRGELRFFREREGGEIDFSDPERFVIVADPAGSGANAPDALKGDPANAYVMDRLLHEQIAEWNGYCDPDAFARELIQLGALYRNPLLIVEAGPWGGHVLSKLKDANYPNLYFRQRLGEALQFAPTNWGQYGWITSAKTKPQMVDALRDMIRNKAVVLNSIECCKELLTFVKNGVKREAQHGCHDDRVMTMCIYALFAMEQPYSPRAKAPPPRIETMGDIMNEMLAAQGQSKGRFRLW